MGRNLQFILNHCVRLSLDISTHLPKIFIASQVFKGPMSSGSQRFYVRGAIVPFEEDFYHEFKGHRNISVEELPPWTQESKTERASRRAVSRSLNAFLNTGKGGTVYLGVVDSGEVRGLQLTENQMEHVRCSLVDLFARYSPPVKPHRYKVKFVPVAESTEEGLKLPKEGPKPSPSGEKPHTLRDHRYCWCDNETVMMYNAGIIVTDYIIEIKIRPWNPEDPHNVDEGIGSVVRVHPLHEDEEGNCYFRRQAGIIKYSMNEIAALTRQEVQEGCKLKVASLKKEIAALKKIKEMSAT